MQIIIRVHNNNSDKKEHLIPYEKVVKIEPNYMAGNALITLDFQYHLTISLEDYRSLIEHLQEVAEEKHNQQPKRIPYYFIDLTQ